MSITDELREWFKDRIFMANGWQEIRDIADRIDAEHQKACDDAWNNGYEADYLGIEKWLTEHPQAMEHHGLVRLPKDVDGEYIHIGDVLQWPEDGDTFEVIGIGDDGVLFYFDPDTEGETADWTASQNKRHYHAPTVEDVLHQFLGECDSAVSLGYDEVPHEVFAKYASKLRLAGDRREQ